MWWGGLSMPESNFTHYENRCSVSEIGLGATQLGDVDVAPARAEAVLMSALDCGINFIDTAARYFESEERIGRFISHRRDEFVVATKCGGYRVRNDAGDFEGYRDYNTRKGILETIDRSARPMPTTTCSTNSPAPAAWWRW